MGFSLELRGELKVAGIQTVLKDVLDKAIGALRLAFQDARDASAVELFHGDFACAKIDYAEVERDNFWGLVERV